jgi:hypothetical protein
VSSRVLAALAATTCAGTLAACGGGERQDANEPSGTYALDVTRASFPLKQRLAQQSRMVVRVRNAGQRTVPAVALTVDGFSHDIKEAGVSDPSRPLWVVDAGPKGGTTAYVGTWSLGALRAGESKTFSWKLTAVVPGAHVVKYRVAAGLDGKARAQRPGGEGAPEGAFNVTVSPRPATARVDPATGDVIRDGERTK